MVVITDTAVSMVENIVNVYCCAELKLAFRFFALFGST